MSAGAAWALGGSLILSAVIFAASSRYELHDHIIIDRWTGACSYQWGEPCRDPNQPAKAIR